MWREEYYIQDGQYFDENFDRSFKNFSIKELIIFQSIFKNVAKMSFILTIDFVKY